jgi:hypothetical protein
VEADPELELGVAARPGKRRHEVHLALDVDGRGIGGARPRERRHELVADRLHHDAAVGNDGFRDEPQAAIDRRQGRAVAEGVVKARASGDVAEQDADLAELARHR